MVRANADRRRLPAVRPVVRLARVSWRHAPGAAFPAAVRPVSRNNHPYMPHQWPDADTATLRRLWADGMGTKEIGASIGVGKNAVIGKARRLGLAPRPNPVGVHPGHPLPAPRPRPVPLPRLDRPVVRKLEPQQACALGRRPPAPPPPAPPQPAPAPHAGIEQCAYPTSDGRPWTFCGAPAVANRPYCAAHCAIAYRPFYRRLEDAA